METMSLDRQTLVTYIILLLIGATLGAFGYHLYRQSQSGGPTVIVREGGYNFINPLLSCDISENKEFSEYQPLKDKFSAYVQQHTANGDAQQISIYFRSLDSGHWSGINEDTEYSPASLLKVPLMIAYLKEANNTPGLLQQTVLYHQTSDANAQETFKPAQSIHDGATYTIQQLIQYMIVDSDNNAEQYLSDHVDQDSLKEVYSDLGLPISDNASDQTMTPKNYSYVFRLLYNATYLWKSSSQTALQLLSTTNFSQGLKAGVPSDVPVAHKFGERTAYQLDQQTGKTFLQYRELHDCGIVYFPQNPYLLCVMTKGIDFTKLAKIISDISAMVYQESASGVLKQTQSS